jgi:8-oxo-dGTP pyrophosphatase MutT (NUDIX family)
MTSDPLGPVYHAGAVPFRRDGGVPEFCLVTSRRTGQWIFPKGTIDPGDSAESTALKEAHEEAGLRGRLLDAEPLGRVVLGRRGTASSVAMYLMEVTACEDEWLESHVRERRWAVYDVARGLLAREDLRQLLDTAFQRIAPPHPHT